MTANHAHTPSDETVDAFFATLRTTYQVEMDKVVGGDDDRLAEYGQIFDEFMAARDARIEAAAEQRGAKRELIELSTHLIKREFPAGHYAGIHTATRIIAGRLLELMVADDE